MGAEVPAMNDCDLCHSAHSTPLPQEPRIHVCKDCGFLYVRERRTVREVAEDWSRIYRDGLYDPNWPGVKARLWYVAEWYGQNFGWEGKSVLDIGAGLGLFLDYARTRGAFPIGLEPDEHNAMAIQSQDIACWYSTIEDAENIGTYDVVSILWTLENTADCMGMLKAAHRHLNPNGHLIVATGSRILVPFKKRLSDYLPGPDREVDTHCYRWSRNSLHLALSMAGFGPLVWNDWESSDVMAVVADGRGCLFEPRDDPAEILEFFERWQRMFP